jgi:putative membrane protein
MKIAMCVGTAVVAMGVGVAFAQMPSSADQKFVTDALRGGRAEVELGKMAATKGSSEEVRRFGQRMADDHTKAGDELKALANRKSIALPANLDPKDNAVETELRGLSGPAFDRAYMEAMVSDHMIDIKEFKKESKSGKDADVRSWASKTLPTLEDHLKQAHETNHNVDSNR